MNKNVSPERLQRKEQYYDEVIRLYYREGLRICEIRDKLSLKRGTIEVWLRKFAEEQAIMSQSMNTEDPQEANGLKSLQDENARLRKQLAKEKLRADSYNELINVAESRYRIKIRKKTGAKQ
ncbi:MAG: transposase [Bacteroidales bacterium]|jgi:transposase-like protein|nr:transposase [Bacteroidales bacterium]